MVKGTRHLVLPYSIVLNDIRFASQPGVSNPADFRDLCIAAYDYLWDEGASNPRMMSIGLHPRWSGQPARTGAVRDFLTHAIQKGDTWFARRIDIAQYWLANYETFTARRT
jgi:hypothetical protein